MLVPGSLAPGGVGCQRSRLATTLVDSPREAAVDFCAGQSPPSWHGPRCRAGTNMSGEALQVVGPRPRQTSSLRARAWTFTVNSIGNDPLPGIPVEFDDAAMKYLCFQAEKAPTTGRDHFQGYVHFRHPQRRDTLLSKRFPRGTFLVASKGSAEENRTYCFKESTSVEGSRQEFGDMPVGQGKRTDVVELRDILDAGGGMLEVAQANFGLFLRYHGGLSVYERLVSSKFGRDFATDVIVYHGPSNSAKSAHVRELAPDAYWLIPGTYTNVWWDGYTGQADVVLDDFYGWLKYSFMLRLCDRYPMTVPTHNGMVNFRAKRIFITSNADPKSWYRRVECSALLRRIRFVYFVDNSVEFPCVEENCMTFPHTLCCRFAAAGSSISSGDIDLAPGFIQHSSQVESVPAALYPSKRPHFGVEPCPHSHSSRHDREGGQCSCSLPS